MQVHSIKSGFCIGKRLNPNFLETKSKMADADNFAFMASSLEFPGRDHVIPGSFVSGLGNPRVFWPGIRDPRRFYYGIWETGSREYKSKLPSFPRGLQILLWLGQHAFSFWLCLFYCGLNFGHLFWEFLTKLLRIS